jgi:hypothetical protein
MAPIARLETTYFLGQRMGQYQRWATDQIKRLIIGPR